MVLFEERRSLQSAICPWVEKQVKRDTVFNDVPLFVSKTGRMTIRKGQERQSTPVTLTQEYIEQSYRVCLEVR